MLLFYQMLDLLLDFLSPPFCVNCKTKGDYFCKTCYQQIDFIKNQTCPACRLASLEGDTHPACLKPGSLNGHQSVALYKGPIKKLIHHLKYKRYPVKKLTRSLKKLLQRYFVTAEDYFEPKTLLAPVPLHWWRENMRGFNQACLIAQALSEIWQLQLLPDLLLRTRPTLPQYRLKKRERRQNVQGLFALNPRYRQKISQQDIVLVDDVYTTGATINECAKVLKKQGQANKVFAVTLAYDAKNMLQ